MSHRRTRRRRGACLLRGCGSAPGSLVRLERGLRLLAVHLDDRDDSMVPGDALQHVRSSILEAEPRTAR